MASTLTGLMARASAAAMGAKPPGNLDHVDWNALESSMTGTFSQQ